MKLWISKNAEVPVREQLSTQIVLAILSGDPPAGARMPSTRELARRLRLHANTISAVYRDLERKGWLEYRKGSGVFLPRRRRAGAGEEYAFDRLLAGMLQQARERGIGLQEVRRKLRAWLESQPPDRLLLIEPDEELRRIFEVEIRQSVDVQVISEDTSRPARLAAEIAAGAMPVFLFNREEGISALLPAGCDYLLIRTRPVDRSLAAEGTIRKDALIAVVSRWGEFLRWTRAVLVAAGVHPDAVLSVDPREKQWTRRLGGATAVVTDVVHASMVPPGPRLVVFRLLSDESIQALNCFPERS